MASITSLLHLSGTRNVAGSSDDTHHLTPPAGQLVKSPRYLRSRRTRNSPLTTLAEQLGRSRFLRGRNKTKCEPVLPLSWKLRPDIEADQTFFPDPKVTFLVDQSPRLICQICRESCMRIIDDLSPQGEGCSSSRSRDSDEIFAIFPCGHIAGSRCLEQWSEQSSSCPFCRKELRYPKCGHKIWPRPLTREGIQILPATLPSGGKLPDCCARCQLEQLRAEQERKWAAASREFQKAKMDSKVRRGRDQAEKLERARKVLDSIGAEARMKHVHFMLHEW